MMDDVVLESKLESSSRRPSMEQHEPTLLQREVVFEKPLSQ